MVLVTIKHMRRSGLDIVVEDFENRVFSNTEQAGKWLRGNGFYFGRKWFSRDDWRGWCRIEEERWEYLVVDIREIGVDDGTDSCYHDFQPKRPGFPLNSLEEDYKEGRRMTLVGMVRKWMDIEGISAEEALDEVGVFDADKRKQVMEEILSGRS